MAVYPTNQLHVFFRSPGWELFVFLYLCFLPLQSNGAVPASELFGRFQQAVYQVSIINNESGEKSAIGSGFAINKDYIVTNYHVVSSIVHFENEYRLVLVNFMEEELAAELVAVDIVHDLALLRSDGLGNARFPLATGEIPKGEMIFSMGNPFDLGMTVIDGTYNGLLDNSRHQRILFSGSLNPGMSGGPAINQRGEVIGVNVAKGPEQISFLVPVPYVVKLVEEASLNPPGIVEQEGGASETGLPGETGKPVGGRFKEIISAQLHREQEEYFSGLLEKEWKTAQIGDWLLPTELTDSFECWGDSSNEKDKQLFKKVEKHCQSNHSLFVDEHLDISGIEFTYSWLESGRLNTIRFYNLVNSYFRYPFPLSGARGFNDSTEYRCSVDFVDISGQGFKLSYCLRQYFDYDDMYDFMLVGVSTNENHKALVFDMTGTGISGELFPRFLNRFLTSLSWQKQESG